MIVCLVARQLNWLHPLAQALHAQLALGASSPPPEQPRPACHHAYLLREMRWLANDFGQVGFPNLGAILPSASIRRLSDAIHSCLVSAAFSKSS